MSSCFYFWREEWKFLFLGNSVLGYDESLRVYLWSEAPKGASGNGGGGSLLPCASGAVAKLVVHPAWETYMPKKELRERERERWQTQCCQAMDTWVEMFYHFLLKKKITKPKVCRPHLQHPWKQACPLIHRRQKTAPIQILLLTHSILSSLSSLMIIFIQDSC